MNWLNFLNLPFKKQKSIRDGQLADWNSTKQIYMDHGMSAEEADRKMREDCPTLAENIDEISRHMPGNNPETG